MQEHKSSTFFSLSKFTGSVSAHKLDNTLLQLKSRTFHERMYSILICQQYISSKCEKKIVHVFPSNHCWQLLLYSLLNVTAFNVWRNMRAETITIFIDQFFSLCNLSTLRIFHSFPENYRSSFGFYRLWSY